MGEDQADHGQQPAGARHGRHVGDQRQVLGVPLYVSEFVAANTLWAVDSSRLWLVVRDDATVEADRSVFFTSDRVAVKATMRAGFGFVHPQSVVKVSIA